MRFLVAVLALAGTGTALAHTPDTGLPGSIGHQLTSLHHSPAAMLLGVLVVVLALVAIRNRATR
jgi:hypothetical protein